MKTVLSLSLGACLLMSIIIFTGCKETGLAKQSEKTTLEQTSAENTKHGTVIFNSIPLGVEVYIDGELKGTTPLTLQLEDGKKYIVEFKDEAHGYETEKREIDNKAGTINVSLRKKREQ